MLPQFVSLSKPAPELLFGHEYNSSFQSYLLGFVGICVDILPLALQTMYHSSSVSISLLPFLISLSDHSS